VGAPSTSTVRALIERDASAGERCDVWWADPASAGPHLLGLLSRDERVRHGRLRRPADRDRYVGAHALLRILLGRRLGIAPAAVVLTGGDGKPRLAGPRPAHQFSLSHSGQRVVVAITTDTPVGVDVERLCAGRDLDALIERVLGPGERSALARFVGPARREAFYRYWVRKESAVKATGHGLRAPLDAITVSDPSRPAELLHWAAADPPTGIRLHDLDPGEGHAGCLATLGTSALAVEEHDGTALLGSVAVS
jgi:4'-phosphopantetheinyl transferase